MRHHADPRHPGAEGHPAAGRDDAAIRRQIGISLQETRLSEKLTVLETVTLFRSLYPEGIEPEDAIAEVSLMEKAGSRVGKLSGGQKQRLAVACAIVGQENPATTSVLRSNNCR